MPVVHHTLIGDEGVVAAAKLVQIGASGVNEKRQLMWSSYTFFWLPRPQ